MPTRRHSEDNQDVIAGISREIKRYRRQEQPENKDAEADRSQAVANGNDELQQSDDDESPLPVDEDGYVEGSIVKITLRNFVTYDYCELTPGPQLNMIIGPNGTGKSTIVCAIALGLGGAPSLLGRAKNIAEFVKTGEDEAMIQIELKRIGGKRNVVIQRRIQKTSNSTSWMLNGRSVPQKDVLKVISELNIQVDNLCQFLPQDKVAEFAQLTPPSLLERTQVAAGAKDLSECHQKLIELRNEEKTLIATHVSDKSHFKTVSDRAKDLQKDVEKLRTREEILKKVKLLKAKLPLAKYTDAKAEYDEAKEHEREQREIIARLEEQLAPIQSMLQTHDTEVKEFLNARQHIDKRVQELNKNLQTIDMRIDRSRNDTKLLEADITRIKQRYEKRKQELRSLEERVENLRRKVGEQPPSEDTSRIDAEIARIEGQLEELENEKVSTFSEYRKAEEELRIIERDVRRKQEELKAFNDIVKRRMHNLRLQHEDTYTAYQWLMQNRNMFRGKIHGPILLQLQLKDTRYADIVESVLGGERGSHLRTFVCEYKEDYELFTKETVDKQRLKLTVSWPDNIDPNAVKPMMPESELREKFGLEHFVSELLEGPQIVKDYLCLQTKINLVPVSLRLGDEERIAERSPFRRYAMQDSMYEVKRYNYGSGGHQTTVRKINPAKLMNDALDGEQYSKVKGELETLRRRFEEQRDIVKTLMTKKEKVNRKEHDLENEMRAKKDEKKNLQFELLEWKKARLALERMEEELETARNQPDTVEQEIEELKQQISSQALHRATLIHEYKNTLKELADSIIERNVIRLQHTQAVAKHDFVKRLTSDKTKLLDEARHSLRRAESILKIKRDAARDLQAEAMRVERDLPADIAEEFKAIMEQWKEEGCLDQSASEIEQAINEETAKAEAIRSTNPRALEQYERYMAEVRQLQNKIDNDAQKLERLQQDMRNTRAHWEPKLRTMVENISGNFSRALQKIGCAGEVCVAPHEDYDNWGIEIRVKFRDHEKLQLLTGQRQSGGERAVSTILYLMALQNVAKAPFRVVDEINQGMDPRNERMIHEQIVKGASRPGTAQYFLITPKLLPDLYYNERMRVLCIYNGEWQPKKLKPLSHYIKNYRTAVA